MAGSTEKGMSMEFHEHWVNFLHRAATGTKKTRLVLTPVGLVIFGVFTGLFVLAAILVDRLLGLPGFGPAGIRFSVARLLIAAGIIIIAWSAFHFIKVKGTPVPFNPPPKVVKTGPYRYVRNPMLAGVFVLLFGIGLAFNSFSLVVFFTPLYVLLNVWELKNIEEPELEKRLGDEYIEYRRKTPMFIPRFRKKFK